MPPGASKADDPVVPAARESSLWRWRVYCNDSACDSASDSNSNSDSDTDSGYDDDDDDDVDVNGEARQLSMIYPDGRGNHVLVQSAKL